MDFNCIFIYKEKIGDLKLIKELCYRRKESDTLVFVDEHGEYYYTVDGEYTEICCDLLLIKISEIKEYMEIVNYYEPFLDRFFTKVEEVPEKYSKNFETKKGYYNTFFKIEKRIYLQHMRSGYRGLIRINLEIEENAQKGKEKLIKKFPNLINFL